MSWYIAVLLFKFWVSVPATTITITPVQSVFDVNDVLTCRATGGNPEPSYEWIDLDTTSLLSRTAELLVSKIMAGKVIYVRCTATTNINGVDHELKIEKSFSVKEQGMIKICTQVWKHTHTLFVIYSHSYLYHYYITLCMMFISVLFARSTDYHSDHYHRTYNNGCVGIAGRYTHYFTLQKERQDIIYTYVLIKYYNLTPVLK